MKIRQHLLALSLMFFLFWPCGAQTAETVFPAIELPAPTGLYRVGTTYLHFMDKTRPEIITPDPTDFRELEVQAWYPVKPGSQSTLAPYWQYSDLTSAALFRSMLSNFPPALGTFSKTSLITLGNSPTHSYLDALVAQDGKPFPVLIFSHGYDGLISQNTALMEELASYGYVVFSISHTYEAVIAVMPGKRAVHRADVVEFFAKHQEEQETILQPLFQKFMAATSETEKMAIYKEFCQKSVAHHESMQRWTADIKFFVDQLTLLNATHHLFKGTLDLDKLGVLGHSFGGAASTQALFEDKRIKACLDLDGRLFETWTFEHGVTGPYMEMMSEPAQTNAMPIVYNMAKTAAYRLFIKGSKHFNYTDVSIFSALFKTIGFIGEIDGKRCIKIYNDYTRAFFDKHLKGLTVPLLDGPSDLYPEVSFESRNVKR